MSKIALADELVKIIETGDVGYAQDYYNAWCRGVDWPMGAAIRIKRACDRWGVDPTRFGWSQLEAATERVTYEADNTPG